MKINKLYLKNFQKHSDLKLEFKDGVNVIYGQTGVGKSCILRAIKWIFFNEGRTSDIRKEGTKQTTVKVTLDNNISIERVVSASKNQYIIYKGEEDKVFNSIGKTIPEEVQELLELKTIDVDNESLIINIAKQISLPFLLDKSGNFRMKLFNKLTGSEITDLVLQSFNKDILQLSRKEKLEDEQLEEKITDLEEIKDEKNKKEKIYKDYKKNYIEFQDKLEELNKYNTIKEKIDKNKENTKNAETLLSNIKTIKEEDINNCKDKINKLEKYLDLDKKLKKIDFSFKDISDKLKQIFIPDIDISYFKKLIEKLSIFKEKQTKINSINKIKLNSQEKLKTIEEKQTEYIKKYKELLKESGICPTCKSKINEDVLKNIKL